MIVSAEEFIKLRVSEVEAEYHRAAHDAADISIWVDVIERYPSFKEWVVHNKTIPLAILEMLAEDADPAVRRRIATKRKIDSRIVSLLSGDADESVRHALISNAALTEKQLRAMHVQDSQWLQAELAKRLAAYK
ncbi:hypothetical protein [Hymenobacter wooponensis]|uniref:HEAT repeat domain-containing protein n=1 Tax=Hymenobacter wooponensis TaxID=1525360 RepID=A0A4Z0MJ44_9BACT|nr:hypothetical protein [Hymenobacter wooponensis]TGD79862.1 hypothetical protein EU557_16760 [Hymenobacter wooponensis]